MSTTRVGQKKRATATLTVDNAPTDATVTWSILAPDGRSVAPLASSNPSTGVYVADFTVDEPGPWTVRFAATGAVVASDEATVHVVASPFYPEN